MSAERKARLIQLQLDISQTQMKLDKLHDERKSLLLQESREHYSCSCVKLNKHLGIYDMTDQDRHNRIGLGLGLVSETLSCKADCTLCSGTGVPTPQPVVENPRHNHFGESFNPQTCPACAKMASETNQGS